MDSLIIMLIFIAITLEILVLFAKYDKDRRKLELRRIAVERFTKQAENRIEAIHKGNELTQKKLAEMEAKLMDFEMQSRNA